MNNSNHLQSQVKWVIVDMLQQNEKHAFFSCSISQVYSYFSFYQCKVLKYTMLTDTTQLNKQQFFIIEHEVLTREILKLFPCSIREWSCSWNNSNSLFYSWFYVTTLSNILHKVFAIQKESTNTIYFRLFHTMSHHIQLYMANDWM